MVCGFRQERPYAIEAAVLVYVSGEGKVVLFLWYYSIE